MRRSVTGNRFELGDDELRERTGVTSGRTVKPFTAASSSTIWTAVWTVDVVGVAVVPTTSGVQQSAPPLPCGHEHNPVVESQTSKPQQTFGFPGHWIVDGITPAYSAPVAMLDCDKSMLKVPRSGSVVNGGGVRVSRVLVGAGEVISIDCVGLSFGTVAAKVVAVLVAVAPGIVDDGTVVVVESVAVEVAPGMVDDGTVVVPGTVVATGSQHCGPVQPISHAHFWNV